MSKPLRILVIEDSEDDTLLIAAELKRAGFDPDLERVDAAQPMLRALRSKSWDIAICDYVLPGFGWLEALQLVRQERIDLPFIVVSGRMGEEVAVEAMRAGADDYVTKGNLARLAPAIERELRDAATRRGRVIAEAALAESEERYRRIVETAVEGIWLLDADGCTTYANRQLAEMLGYTVEEMLGRPEYAFADEEQAAEIRAVLECPLKQQERKRDVRFRHKDGRDVWVILSATEICDDSGRLTGHLAMLSEITQRKVAERELEHAYNREHHIADVLQRALLLDVDMDFGGYQLLAGYRPALSEAEVGGDFYDVFETSGGRLVLAMGDVSGKGLSAAVHTAMAKYMIRAFAHEIPDAESVVCRVNSAICDYTPPELFVSLFYGVLDPVSHTLTYCLAGHERPIVVRPSGQVIHLETTGPVAGAFEKVSFSSSRFEFAEGDVMLAYTDGITDARSGDRILGVDGLSDALRLVADRSPREIVDAAFDAAFEAAGGAMRDDAAVFVVTAPRDRGRLQRPA